MTKKRTSKLEARELERVQAAFLSLLAGSVRELGNRPAARYLKRRAVACAPVSLIHNGRKARK